MSIFSVNKKGEIFYEEKVFSVFLCFVNLFSIISVCGVKYEIILKKSNNHYYISIPEINEEKSLEINVEQKGIPTGYIKFFNVKSEMRNKVEVSDEFIERFNKNTTEIRSKNLVSPILENFFFKIKHAYGRQQERYNNKRE